MSKKVTKKKILKKPTKKSRSLASLGAKDQRVKLETPQATLTETSPDLGHDPALYDGIGIEAANRKLEEHEEINPALYERGWLIFCFALGFVLGALLSGGLR